MGATMRYSVIWSHVFMFVGIYMCRAYGCGVGKKNVGKYMDYFVVVVDAEVIYVFVCATC